LARDLFREDSAAYYQDLLTYAVPELETLESAYAWVSRLGSEALSSDKLIDQLDPAMLTAFRGALQSRNSTDESAATISRQRVRAKRAITRRRLKGAKTQVKRRQRAK
jgi:hypothetical protein